MQAIESVRFQLFNQLLFPALKNEADASGSEEHEMTINEGNLVSITTN